MTTQRLGVQLFSVFQAMLNDVPGTLRRIADLGYDHVEAQSFTGTPFELFLYMQRNLPEGDNGMPADGPQGMPTMGDIKQAAEAASLDIPSCHVYLPEGDTAEAIFDEQEMLGSHLLVAPSIYDPKTDAPFDFSDLEEIKRLAERFNVAAERARARGMRIGYHNHFDDFHTDFDGRTGLEVFYDLCEPDVFAEVDVYWAQVGGRDPVDLIKSLGERVELVHVKDGTGVMGSFGDPTMALGRGSLDIRGILDASVHASALIVEIEWLGDAVWDALAESHRFVVDHNSDVSNA